MESSVFFFICMSQSDMQILLHKEYVRHLGKFHVPQEMEFLIVQNGPKLQTLV